MPGQNPALTQSVLVDELNNHQGPVALSIVSFSPIPIIYLPYGSDTLPEKL